MDWHEHAQQEHFSRSPRWPWLIVLVAVAAGGVFVVTRGGPEEPDPVWEPLELVAVDEPAVEEEPESPPALPKQQTDALVRELLGDRFPLAGVGDLVRRFVSAVNQIADGESPRAQLEPVAPKRGFIVRRSEGDLVVDERSHRRYDAAAGLLASIDATRMAVVYRQLEPALEGAQEELGARDRTFRETLALATDHLNQTPVPDGPIRLKRDRIFYAFADPSLEGLSDAQKQLLRMGPRNARIVQASLREWAAALELPPVKQGS